MFGVSFFFFSLVAGCVSIGGFWPAARLGTTTNVSRRQIRHYYPPGPVVKAFPNEAVLALEDHRFECMFPAAAVEHNDEPRRGWLIAIVPLRRMA